MWEEKNVWSAPCQNERENSLEMLARLSTPTIFNQEKLFPLQTFYSSGKNISLVEINANEPNESQYLQQIQAICYSVRAVGLRYLALPAPLTYGI